MHITIVYKARKVLTTSAIKYILCVLHLLAKVLVSSKLIILKF